MVLDAETFLQTKVRHDAILSKGDIALVHCQGCHYVPVCKYLVSHCAPTVNNSIPTVKFSTWMVNYCAPTDLAFLVHFHISSWILPKCTLRVKYSTSTVDHSTPTVNYCTLMGKYLSWFFQYGALSQLMMKDTSVITCVPWQWTPSKKQQAILLKGKIRQ